VHQSRAEPLQELPLAEDDRRLVPDSRGDVVRARGRLAGADEPGEEDRAPAEERAGDPDRGDERDR
jgi:hypothetical protein